MTLTFTPPSPPPHAGSDDHGESAVPNAVPDHIPLVAPSGGSLVDWSVALNAMPMRLRQIVGLRLATESGLTVNDLRARIQLGVLECATAMERMNVLLLRELQRCRGLEHSPGPVGAAPVPARTAAPAAWTEARHATPLDRQSPMVQRQLFRHRLDRALSDAEGPAAGLALLTIDLEGFRSIAETHGPDVSDHVLRIIAARVSGAVRAADMVGRIGVQEFGCVITGAMTRRQLCQVACKIFDATSTPLRMGALWLQVAPSIGIAHGNACAAGAAGMLLGANGAMLQAKQRDIGYAFFDPPSRRPRRPGTSPRRAAPRPLAGKP